MTPELIISLIFYAIAAVLLFSATMVIVSRSPIHSALFLVLAFFASAGLWILLEAEFLALLLVLVYVGAVMTLFLFVVMTINLDRSPSRKGFIRYAPFGVLILAVLIALLIYVVSPSHSNFSAYHQAIQHGEKYSNTQELGMVLYTEYAYPFLIAGILLLVGIISAISLTARLDRTRKLQVPEDQMKVRREDRVRLVKISAEGKS